MAILRHRDVEAVMPPEVRRRARKAGVGAGTVDWYAGRRYDAKTSAAEMPPPASSQGVSGEVRDRRRQFNKRTADARRKEVSGALRAIVSLPSRLSHLGRSGLTVK